jgi:hypothetical protein
MTGWLLWYPRSQNQGPGAPIVVPDGEGKKQVLPCALVLLSALNGGEAQFEAGIGLRDFDAGEVVD